MREGGILLCNPWTGLLCLLSRQAADITRGHWDGSMGECKGLHKVGRAIGEVVRDKCAMWVVVWPRVRLLFGHICCFSLFLSRAVSGMCRKPALPCLVIEISCEGGQGRPPRVCSGGGWVGKPSTNLPWSFCRRLR